MGGTYDGISEYVGLADFIGLLTPYFIVVLLTIIPAIRILRSVGLSRAWALLAIIPPGSVLIFWIVAFKLASCGGGNAQKP